MKSIVSLTLGMALSTAVLAQTPDPWDPHHPHREPNGFDDPNSSRGLTDGTPVSTTSLAARDLAMDNAFIAIDEVAESFEDMPSREAPGIDSTTREYDSAVAIDLGFGSSKVDGMEYDLYTLRIPYSRTLNSRGSISLVAPLSFTRAKDSVLDADGVGTKDASIYGGGLVAAYSHRVFNREDGKPYRWKVTPAGGVFLRESSDLNQGSWVYNVGLSSSFAYRLHENWVVNMGNSISAAWNSGRKNYPDPVRDNQQVVINGLQLFYLSGRWIHHGYVMDTRFLRSNFIDDFQSYAIGTGYRVTRTRSVKATLVYEDGKRYDSLRAMFGTSWKF